MANKIILKKSSVATKAPIAGDLDFGELAINYTDSKLYFKKADGSIDAFTSSAASAPVTSVGGNIGDITDAQLLASIKNVDGTGSGLDADFLDGNSAAAFYLASNPSGYTSNTGTVTSVGATAPIVSSGGTTPSLSIAAANSTTDGYMTSVYATKLDGIAAGAQVNVATNLAQGTRTTTTVPVTSSTGTTATLDIATTSLAGVMSSADKTKLDGIASGATANTGTVTGVTGTAPIVSSGGTAPTISISAATTLAAGSMSASDKTKLDGIASGATANTGTVTSVAAGSYLAGGTITTSGTLSVDATVSNTASKVVARDGSGNFQAGIITTAGRQENYGINTNAATQAGIFGGTSAGTLASPTQTPTGTTLYNISSNGYTGSVWTGTAGIDFVSTEAITATNRGSNVVLRAIAAGQGTATTVVWNGTTLNANGTVLTGNTGTVTAVTATAPVASSGGTTPVISMAAASSGVNGYMTGAYATKLDGIAAGATNVTNTNQLTNGAGYITSSGSITGNSGTVGGLSVHAGRNNEANKIVRTDANGYIQAGWINTDSGDSGISNRLTRIYSSSDAYLRYSTLTDFKVHMGLSAKNNYSRAVDYTTDANYHVGSIGQSAYGANETFHGGSAFFDIWSGTNYPGGLSHIQGFNVLHYTVNSLGSTGGNAYGIQVAGQYDQGGEIWSRGCSGGTFSAWRRQLDSSNYNSYSPTLTGGGASGTWSISINGTASSASTAISANSAAALSTNLPVSRLNSGTSASSSTFWRGDGLWATPASPVIGTTTQVTYNNAGTMSGSANLTFNGTNLTVGGSVIHNSDESLKTNWRELPDDFVDLLALVKSGTYDRLDQELTQDGVSAQSLQPLLPNSVLMGVDGKLSVAYGNAAMVSSIELAKRIVEQDKKIARLEALVLKLIEG